LHSNQRIVLCLLQPLRPPPSAAKSCATWATLLRTYKEPLGELITLEMGKIRAEGMGEVQEMIDICDFAVGLSRQLYGLTMHSERPATACTSSGTRSARSASSPPSTFPWRSGPGTRPSPPSAATPALEAHRTDVPLTAVAVQHLANQVMADHGLTGVFTLAVGAGDVGRWMTEDARLPLISFTGSIPTGRRVAQTVAGRLGRTMLELGGNNAIIVSDEADLDLATRAILFGAVGTAGQRCTSTRRHHRPRAVVDEL
jgi:aldehyde dehydrogenase (NAD+)